MSYDDEIRKTLALYPKAADSRNAEAYAELFTEDAVLVSRRGVFIGRKAIRRYLEENFAAQPEGKLSRHVFGNHVIRVSEFGEMAEVSSDLLAFECLTNSPWRVKDVFHHTDKMARQPDGRWLFTFKHMGGTVFVRTDFGAPARKTKR